MIYSDIRGSLWFYCKDEAVNFNNYIANTEAFKSLKYIDKLLGNIVAQPTSNNDNGILKNEAVAVLLKYLSNYWRSLETPLIDCKVEWKLRWTKHCVLSVLGKDNDNGAADSNNIIFTIKDIKLYMSLSSVYQQKTIKSYKNFLAKDTAKQTST